MLFLPLFLFCAPSLPPPPQKVRVRELCTATWVLMHVRVHYQLVGSPFTDVGLNSEVVCTVVRAAGSIQGSIIQTNSTQTGEGWLWVWVSSRTREEGSRVRMRAVKEGQDLAVERS